MVEAVPVKTPMGSDREKTVKIRNVKPKPARMDRKTQVTLHHPNTYFFKKYAKTLIPVSRVYLMSEALSDSDDQGDKDARLSSEGAK